ncbi:MAG TPA: DUF2516 family protein [Nocardioidaceae bacterium]
MPFVFDIQNTIVLIGAVLLFVLEGWALVDAVIRRPEEFVAADKQTKTMWLAILAVALVAHMIFWHPISLLNLAGAVASIVYLVEVRPALQAVRRR